MYIKKKKSVSGSELTDSFGISRQALNKHLKALIQKRKVAKVGTTKGAVYKIARRASPKRHFRKNYLLKNLEEDKVFAEIDLFLKLRKKLRENVFDIVNYAFTEILNNAIDHSRSKKCSVEVGLDQYSCNFKIRDLGIGIFYSVYSKLNLQDENSAVGELIKGKTTTAKEKHTGEGVFFTSKSGDNVAFRSHRTNLIFDNVKRDIIVEEKKFMNGTEVDFTVGRASSRLIDRIFKQYAPEAFDYKFEKTRVFVKLFQKEYISRSEAKRLLSGLDKFKEIVLDFIGVKALGQGFVDEVFRVFQKQHPDITIKIENLSPILASIIKHVVDNKI